MAIEIVPTRQQAKANGLTRYFGKPCTKHPELKGERQVANCHCPRCQYIKQDKECRAGRTHRWHQANKKHVAAVMHAWRQNNKERTIALHHAYHARKRGAPGHFTAVDIQRLWNEQNGVCAAPHCSTSLEVSCTVEHKIPLSRGGSNWPANLQLFCSPCNSSKGTKTMAEWLAVLDARRQPCLTEIATPCHSINCKEHLTPSPECAITSPLAQ